MKTKKQLGMSGYITLTFYVAFITLPFLFFGGSNIEDGFRCTFVTFPSNYLLYIAPAALYFFLKKADINENDKLLYLAVFDSVTVVIMHRALQTNRSDVYFTFIAVIILSSILMNMSNSFSAILLVAGLLIFRSPEAYIFAAYIPVLLLLLIQKPTENGKQSDFLLYTYMYIPVLILILFIAKKITFNIQPAYLNLTNTYNAIEFFSGFALVLICAAFFVIRCMPVIKHGSMREKTGIILLAVYPVAISVANCFYMLAALQQIHTFLLAVVMYIAANIHISLNYKEKAEPIIPQKLSNPVCIAAMIIIFCTFSFK